MTLFDPFPALALPPEALIDRRVPKTLLIENGSFASRDRRRIREGVEELKWLAALKPRTIGVAEYHDATRRYLEIAVLRLDLRPTAGGGRLVELVHRAVPHPVLLITWRSSTPEVSLAHKRWSLGNAEKTVLDGELIAVQIDGDSPTDLPSAFLKALALERQPQGTLQALYQGWIDIVHALRAARVTGTFNLPATAAAAADREAALREYRSLDETIAALRSGARKHTQMSRRVATNMELARLRSDRDAARARL